MEYKVSAIIMAYILDLIFGDPQISWHPVRFIGRFVEKLERMLNKGTINNRKFSGAVLVMVVVGVTIFCVWSSLKLAMAVHPIPYYIVSTLLIYFALSIKSLAVEANKVYQALSDNKIVNARKELSMIVARDTDKLGQPDIIRATVETTAESIMDGIIAPLFYVFLGGPIFIWAYKAINTLDSMVGYRSERFIDFGKASAKIDGIANFIPAKLTCLVIFISSFTLKKFWQSCGRWSVKYFLRGPEYNSEATEATLAGALGVQLGGLNFYNCVPILKNIVGENICPLDLKHIKESIKILYTSSALFIAMGISLIWMTGRG